MQNLSKVAGRQAGKRELSARPDCRGDPAQVAGSECYVLGGRVGSVAAQLMTAAGRALVKLPSKELRAPGAAMGCVADRPAEGGAVSSTPGPPCPGLCITCQA